ncbi:macrophage immunometabolism regulator [Grus japonensis]|uniref:ribonuclease H n=1 Tax=Grus japonensis TaxID=30415 RepID=A0ABC9YCI4_GRUJA
MTVDYRGLKDVMPPMSAAVPDMLELQYELESKAVKWYAMIDIANVFFSIPLAAECRPQFAFTWRGVQYTWNRLPQGRKHSPTICHGLIQSALEKGEAPEHLQYVDDIIVWGNSAAEFFEKRKKIVHILLKASFPTKQSIVVVGLLFLSCPSNLSGEEGFKLKLPREGNLNPSHSYQFDASASNTYPEPGEGSQVSRRAPEVRHKGIPATPASKSASSGAQLKCLYANAHSMGNKQEELETCTRLHATLLPICWRDNTAECKQSRKFLEHVDDNFLLQVIEEPMRRGGMIDLVLTNKEGLVGDVKLKGSLGCSDHEMVEFRILRAARRAHSKLTTLDFRRADFGLFRDLLGRIPWDKALEGRGAQDSWLIFKGHLLQAQEQCIPAKRKSSKNTRRPA